MLLLGSERSDFAQDAKATRIRASGDPAREPRAKRPALDVSVKAVVSLTPSMRRITFEGAALAGLAAPLPAQWVKVLLPTTEGQRQPSRAYTIRRFDAAALTLDVDFVLHGDAGPASAWARRARVDDRIGVTPARGGHAFAGGAAWRLLAGDETALPASAAILEVAPADAPIHVFVEVPADVDEQPLAAPAEMVVRWLPRDGARPGSRLVAAVQAWQAPSSRGQVFLAGEACAVKTLRMLFSHLPPDLLDAKGYWALGQADHRG